MPRANLLSQLLFISFSNLIHYNPRSLTTWLSSPSLIYPLQLNNNLNNPVRYFTSPTNMVRIALTTILACEFHPSSAALAQPHTT